MAQHKLLTNTFEGLTTIIIQVERDLDLDTVRAISDELLTLSWNTCDKDHPTVGPWADPRCYYGHLHGTYTHDEDIRTGHQFVVLSKQDESTIRSVYDYIVEMIEAARFKCL